MAEVEIGVLVAFAVLEFWQFRRLAAETGPIRMPPRRSSTGINSPLEEFSLVRPRASYDTQETGKQSKSRHARNSFPIGFSPVRRGSISCESMSEEDLCWTAPRIPKSEAEKELLLRILKKNVLMEHLGAESLEAVVQALQKVQVAADQVVVAEGDFGDGSYIVEEGKLSCYMKKSGHKCDYGPVSPTQTDTFGEIALMYGNIRAATIQAQTPCTLWKLDRDTFKKIVLNAMLPTHAAFTAFINKVPIFRTS